MSASGLLQPVVLYDQNGNELSVLDGAAVAAATPGVYAMGSDGANARRLRTAVDGTLRIDPTGTTPQVVAQGAGAGAAAPWSARLTDGATFYIAALAAQFPALLVGGRLDVNVGASVLPTGAATEVTLATRVAATQLPAALVGGRLDANVGAWLGSTAPTVGQKTLANSVPVAVASDQLLTAQPRSSTPAQSTVAASATNVTLLASNANRRGATVHNDSALANLFVKLGATASATSFTARLLPNGYYEVPFGYTGIIDGIWSLASGNARITELT